MSKNILLTGGFGFIGRHTTIELLKKGYNVIVIDSNKIEILEDINNKIYQLTGKKASLNSFRINSEEDLRVIFKKNKIDAVIHFAGIKSVSEFYLFPFESMNKELTLIKNVLNVMKEFNVNNIIYPSSILVYSAVNKMPLTENSELNKDNPYSKCKIQIENILNELSALDKKWNILILRYSNTIGNHQSGLIDGYVPEKPNNLTSAIMSFFDNDKNKLRLFGNDFDTKDGTCERDYIHIVDVAKSNLAAVNFLFNNNLEKPLVLNISSGKPHSVIEVIQEFEKVFSKTIDYEIFPKRDSDVSCSYSDNSLARQVLNWDPKSTLNDTILSFIR